MIKILQYSEKFQSNSVFQGKRELLKNPECKKHIQCSKIRATLFFRARANCSKILNDKKYIFNTVKIFRAHSLFQDKCKLLKTPECKKYIQYSEQFQGNSVFQGQAQVAQKCEL